MKYSITGSSRARTLTAALVTVAVAAGLTACGGSSHSTPDPSGGGGGSTAPASDTKVAYTGAPVTIYVEVPIQNAIGDLSEVPAAARAAAATINAHGGLDGHEVKIATCNDSDPNAEVACARQAVSSKALAFVGSTFVLNPGAAENIVASADLPSVAPELTNTVEYSIKTNFPVDGAVFGFFTCGAQAAQLTGAKKVAFLAQDYPVQKQLGSILGKTTQALGGSFAGAVYVPASQTDLTPAVAQLKSDGAQVVVSGLTPTLVPSYLQALTETATQVSSCLIPVSFRVDDLAQLGSAAGNAYVASGLPAPSAASKYPLVREFVNEMAAEKARGDAAADLTVRQPINALRAWLGMHIIAQVAKTISGPLDSHTLFAALNKATMNLGGITPTLDFAKPLANKAFSRVFNDQVMLLKWDPASKSLVDTDRPPIHVRPLIGG